MEEPIGSPIEPDSSSPTKEEVESFQDSEPAAYDNDEAQIDPRGQTPQPYDPAKWYQGTRTSLFLALFEVAIETSLLEMKFPDGCSTIFKLEKYTRAWSNPHFCVSFLNWRKTLKENKILRMRLFKQHQTELEKLTYPLPKKPGSKVNRKRGYRDKGSTRPFHTRGRTDSETLIAIHYLNLQVVEKVRVYGRRPTVTYRRLPYSSRIREALELGLLERVGDFYIPTLLEKN